MNHMIAGGQRYGSVTVPASKSQAHRQLICAALSEEPSELICDGMSNDIEATIACMKALGAEISQEGSRIRVTPVPKETPADEICHLYCQESGSTLRFLIPVVGALGRTAVFHMEGRLPERPLAPFDEELIAHDMEIRKEGDLLYCSGQLTSGDFTLPGNISSQYISGLLLALPLLKGNSTLSVTGTVESENYILMTEDVVRSSGIVFQKDAGWLYQIAGGQSFRFPKSAVAERDWSNATFFLCMGALSEHGIAVDGLSLDSSQGDKAVLDILAMFGAEVIVNQEYPAKNDGEEAASATRIFVGHRPLKGIDIDASKIPDMVPALSAVAAAAKGITHITHAERLRMKESDRLKTVTDMLTALGADITETTDGLLIIGKPGLKGGAISAAGDHRIAMAAAVAACVCDGAVTISGSECVNKSYPGFFEDLAGLKLQ